MLPWRKLATSTTKIIQANVLTKKNQANDEVPIYVILKSSIWTSQNTVFETKAKLELLLML